jgi:simple sugar transport system ATP-binding protein
MGGVHPGSALFLNRAWLHRGKGMAYAIRMKGVPVEQSGEYVLRMKGIAKSYYGNKVLKGIDLDMKPGEVHGIVGENGAGKSTLMNILFGMSVIHSTGGYEGSIEVAGQPVQRKEPLRRHEARHRHGASGIHAYPGYSITENIKLNREITKDNLLSRVMGPSLKTLDWWPWARTRARP